MIGEKTEGHCDRCLNKSAVFIMSMFNTDVICSSCKTEEKNHPDYEKASEAETKEVMNGNNNFEGIGLPDDLAIKYKPLSKGNLISPLIVDKPIL